MKWNLTKQATTPTYKNPKTIRKLIFTDRLNTAYYVDDQPIESFVIGETKTYVDYIRANLDPNIESNQKVYGIAKTLDPLTTRINRMKDSINGANSELYNIQKVLAEQENIEKSINSTETEKGDSNVPNTAS